MRTVVLPTLACLFLSWTDATVALAAYMFRYHEYGSKKLNAHQWCIARMVFLTCTQKSRYIYKSCIAIFTECTVISMRSIPLHRQQNNPAFLTWRASFFARGDEYPSTLVSCLSTTAPPLGFYPSHPFTPHSSNYIIYIDDINNLGGLRPGQYILKSVSI
jgi:hypothetical protein